MRRIQNRARDDDSSSLIDIKKREEREIGFGLLELINTADYVIKNNSTIENLKKNTRKLINQLIRNYKAS